MAQSSHQDHVREGHLESWDFDAPPGSTEIQLLEAIGQPDFHLCPAAKRLPPPRPPHWSAVRGGLVDGRTFSTTKISRGHSTPKVGATARHFHLSQPEKYPWRPRGKPGLPLLPNSNEESPPRVENLDWNPDLAVTRQCFPSPCWSGVRKRALNQRYK